METDLSERIAHPVGEQPEVEEWSAVAETFAGRVHIEWDTTAAVTPLGQLPFFIEYLKQGGLFDGWVADCPLVFTSPNAPRKRDVLGTLLLLEMFQPPLSIGSRLAPRATTLPHSSVCRSMFMPIFCSTSVATCASA